MTETSMTAKICLFARAYHHDHSRVPVFSDPVASQLLSAEERSEIARSMQQGVQYFFPGFTGTPAQALDRIVRGRLAPSPLGRAAFAEDVLRTAVTIGTRQYLILGAGYDTFALRQPDWARNLTIIELDRPQMQRDKLDRIARAGLSLPDNVTLLPTDLSNPAWAQQLRACPSFNPKAKTLCSLLGLIYYLTEAEFAALLASLSELLPPGSALAFDYPAPQGDGAQSQLAAGAGEPMKAVYPYDRMERLLADHGFRIYEHLDDTGLEKRFFERHNLLEHRYPIHPLPGVCCCLAVHR